MARKSERLKSTEAQSSFPHGGGGEPQREEPEPLATIDQVAAFLGLSPATIRKWRERGEVPFTTYSVGRRVRFKLSEVDEWVRTQTTRNGTEARLGR